MGEAQQAIHDRIVRDNGRTGFGPAIGYAYSAGVWDLHNRSSNHLLECTLTPVQIRIVSLLTVRHWNAEYPWSAQAKTALKAGLDPAVIEAINNCEEPRFDDKEDAAVYAAANELLKSGTLSDEGFVKVEGVLGCQRLVEVVGAIGHFCTTAMMANTVGVVPAPDAPSHLKTK
jgi:4-carboxymuconolactone decarboxylase